MHYQSKLLIGFLILSLFVAVPTIARPARSAGKTLPQARPQASSFAGKWRVTFSFSGQPAKHLIFTSQPEGSGSFDLTDTGPDNEPGPRVPAVWSSGSNDRLSFSGDAEMALGTCCREVGTLVFKGRFTSSDTISGGLIFVTGIEEEESPTRFRSLVGKFTATRQ